MATDIISGVSEANEENIFVLNIKAEKKKKVVLSVGISSVSINKQNITLPLRDTLRSLVRDTFSTRT